MGKTIKGKDKAERKLAAARIKIAKKTKRSAAAVACIALALFVAGCVAGCVAPGDQQQPSRSQTQNNDFRDCIVVVASQCTVSNRIVRADGSKDVPSLELFTQTLANDGSETVSPTATATPTMDVRPDIDVEVPVNKSGGGAQSVGSVLGDAAASLIKGVVDKGSTASAGASSTTLPCTDGNCTDGSCADGSCNP